MPFERAPHIVYDSAGHNLYLYVTWIGSLYVFSVFLYLLLLNNYSTSTVNLSPHLQCSNAVLTITSTKSIKGLFALICHYYYCYYVSNA